MKFYLYRTFRQQGALHDKNTKIHILLSAVVKHQIVD